MKFKIIMKAGATIEQKILYGELMQAIEKCINDDKVKLNDTDVVGVLELMKFGFVTHQTVTMEELPEAPEPSNGL